MFIIAEIAQAHEGSLEQAHAYIEALAQTGVNAVKFQTHIADAESSIHEPFRVVFSDAYKTRFDYWKEMEFSLDEWIALKKHCEQLGLEFISSPFSNAAVDLLEKVGVKRYKIGSGEVTNFLLLEKIAQTGKPVILSSGMSSFEELDRTIVFLKAKKVPFSLLQTTTAYPTQAENYGLNVISELRERYQVPIGYSDHSARIEVGIAAYILGAEILEFHVTLDKNSMAPDTVASLTIEETKTLVSSIRNLEIANKNPVVKTNNSDYLKLKAIFEKSLAVNKDLPSGHILTFEDLEAKKPKGYGIDAKDFQKVIGEKINRALKQWDFLNKSDLLVR